MFYTNTNNTSIQADINTSIHDHLLHKAVWTQGTVDYQPTRSRKASRGSNNWLSNLIASLIGNAGQPFDGIAQAAR